MDFLEASEKVLPKGSEQLKPSWTEASAENVMSRSRTWLPTCTCGWEVWARFWVHK